MLPQCQNKSILKKSIPSEPKELSNGQNVWFSSVEIHYHPTILGDNPAVGAGAPIAIGWKPTASEMVDVNMYEATRKMLRRKPGSNNMKLPVQERAMLLLQNGFTIADLARSVEETDLVRKQRIQSFDRKKWERIDEFAENSGKVFRRLTRLNRGAARVTQVNPAA